MNHLKLTSNFIFEHINQCQHSQMHLKFIEVGSCHFLFHTMINLLFLSNLGIGIGMEVAAALLDASRKISDKEISSSTGNLSVGSNTSLASSIGVKIKKLVEHVLSIE